MDNTSIRPVDRIEEIMDTYGDRLFRLCLVTLGNASDAEDAVQETFLTYIKKTPVFKDPEHEKAWLIRVTANACKDLLKNFFRRNTVSLETVGEKSWELSEEHLTIHQAVHTLPKNYREVIYLHYYEGYTAVEIAGILKRNPNTVYTHLRKGKELLREALDNG